MPSRLASKRVWGMDDGILKGWRSKNTGCTNYRAMHHDYVPMNRFGIKKCLSQAVQEVKPEASSLDNPWSSLRSGVTRG